MGSRFTCRLRASFSLAWRVCFVISGLIYALASLKAESYFYRATTASYREDARSDFEMAAKVFPLRQDFVKQARHYGERR